ncbi:6-phosphogluconate dehydrogenase [Flavobacterium sp.]|uniref:6-phosphogluconate dehydrogenase n=1 Tax=Flavobacterium sp. TaxID=239 RepID=UPI000EDF72EF|nr:6-phosphogluconate dehydrogenase [Flavobacterium sp.]HCQ11903.1 6-phosphogluconate dehydrogenase [Flavobacterium sp.]
MLRKVIMYFVLALVLVFTAYFSFVYFATYSEGNRSGELIKFSKKGYVFKTWEGELSQGISGAQIFKFSVMDNEAEVIQQMKDLQGEYVKVTYVERYRTFPWWGETNYYITDVVKEDSPFKVK